MRKRVIKPWQKFNDRLLFGIARRVAPGAEHLWEDMVQEGWLRLVTATQVPERNPDAYYRAVAKYGMVDFLRREKEGRVVLSFTRAKHLGLLNCPSCSSTNIAWTVFWPSLVRCRDCAELFAVEDTESI